MEPAAFRERSLIGAVPPVMVKSATNPGGLPLDVFDKIRSNVLENRSQFYRDLAIPFYGYNRPNAKPSQGVIDSFCAQGMLGSIKGQYDCVKQFSEVDYPEDLKKIDVPTLILHGDADQIVPIDDAGRLSAKIVKKRNLKGISRCASRHVYDASRQGQPGFAGIRQGLAAHRHCR